MYNDTTLYPMLGVGAFVVMFWTGFVTAAGIGLGCFAFLACGLGFGALGTLAVSALERSARRPSARGRTARAAPDHDGADRRSLLPGNIFAHAR